MIPAWIAALAAVVVILINLLTAAVTYGSLQAQTKNNTKSIDDLKQDVAHGRDQQWTAINAHTEDIAYLQGQGASKGASAGGHD